MNNILLSRDEQGRYILRIDSSLLKNSNCSRRVYFEAIRGLSEQSSSEAADYGTAAHRVLQAWYESSREGSSIPNLISAADYRQKCLEIGQGWFRSHILETPGSWRTLARFTKLMNSYFAEYQENDRLVANPGGLEQKFEYLWHEDSTVVVYLCGTKDFIGTYNGEEVIVDHKTNTPFGFKKRDDLIEEYLNSYRFSPQGKVYVLHEKLTTGRDVGFMVNGLFLEKSGKNSFKRSEVFRWGELEMNLFRYWLDEQIFKIVEAFKELLSIGRADFSFLPNFTVCDGEKWPCRFKCLCAAQDDEHRELLVKNNFTAAERNPLKFQE